MAALFAFSRSQQYLLYEWENTIAAAILKTIV